MPQSAPYWNMVFEKQTQNQLLWKEEGWFSLPNNQSRKQTTWVLYDLHSKRILKTLTLPFIGGDTQMRLVKQNIMVFVGQQVHIG